MNHRYSTFLTVLLTGGFESDLSGFRDVTVFALDNDACIQALEACGFNEARELTAEAASKFAAPFVVPGRWFPRELARQDIILTDASGELQILEAGPDCRYLGWSITKNGTSVKNSVVHLL
ncbi:fasciclin domain-containing protein [Gymnodinialimonas hymeniacidonis]|uniref:fasciclin domain-containing protein n=1 Tax=Gymnodinialimonas hymeniacidonis TaxID=3126508 RepID=UPI0034C64A50